MLTIFDRYIANHLSYNYLCQSLQTCTYLVKVIIAMYTTDIAGYLATDGVKSFSSYLT